MPVSPTLSWLGGVVVLRNGGLWLWVALHTPSRAALERGREGGGR